MQSLVACSQMGPGAGSPLRPKVLLLGVCQGDCREAGASLSLLLKAARAYSSMQHCMWSWPSLHPAPPGCPFSAALRASCLMSLECLAGGVLVHGQSQTLLGSGGWTLGACPAASSVLHMHACTPPPSSLWCRAEWLQMKLLQWLLPQQIRKALRGTDPYRDWGSHRSPAELSVLGRWTEAQAKHHFLLRPCKCME